MPRADRRREGISSEGVAAVLFCGDSVPRDLPPPGSARLRRIASCRWRMAVEDWGLASLEAEDAVSFLSLGGELRHHRRPAGRSAGRSFRFDRWGERRSPRCSPRRSNPPIADDEADDAELSGQ